jgi:hypothetical protein
MMTRTSMLLLLTVVLLAPRPATAADPFDQHLRAAMAPYYAALLTSARGDGEGTLRHLVVLRARWASVQGVPASARPAWAAQPVLDGVATRLDRARKTSTSGQIARAHGDLESIRALLRDARRRAGVRTFDDAVTDYHEALERLTGRTGLHNEIELNADDYTAIQEQVARAASVWTEIAAGRTPAGNGNWAGLSGATEKALGVLRIATASRDMDATQTAAETLKARYFDLLAILARA